MSGRCRGAVEFAYVLKRQCEGPLAADVRGATKEQREHKKIGVQLDGLLGEFLGHEVAECADWEGAPRAPGTQRQSYLLLGTASHPDAAVLEPFKVAIEFDRESATPGNISHFKTCLMKTACHVLSGAYDAALLVFTLSRKESTPDTYLKDYEPGFGFTDQLLANLRTQGVVIAFVPVI